MVSKVCLVSLAASLALLACAVKTSAPNCPTGETDCSGNCFDLSSDLGHCGGCVGHACPSAASCEAGVCTCPGGQTACGNACVDLETSASDCGACGHGCGLGTCVNGACACQASPVVSCGPSASPECVDSQKDPSNCGSCGLRCASVLANAQCQGGSCQCLAPTPDECNHDACTSLATDPKNCGGCNNACPLEGEVCASGACSCPSSLPNVCGASPGACVNEALDPRNCGACGNACATFATCSASACHCPTSAPDVCGTSPGTCVDEARDPKNCGACGTTCPSAATCSSSSCACPAANPTLCGNSSGNPGSCCAGPACCGAGCETVHSNGLGESYFDCGKTGTFTEAQAIAAAQAFAPTGTVVLAPLCASCVCVNTDSQAAIWCYAGSQLAGLGQLFDAPDCTQAFCPTPGFSTTFHWN